MPDLAGKTCFITGSSRGIGRAIALRCAQDGANVVVIGKTVKPHEKLSGTIYTVADEVREAGGQALALGLDVRDEMAIDAAVQQVVDEFGGIDVLINNASAISLTPTLSTSMKRFDLMIGVNVRATFACAKACIPYLKQSSNPHILTMSPPLNMAAKWFKDHLAYTYSKYGMSMCTLGLSAEFKADGIAVNSLWPRTTIATAAVEVHFPPEILAASRTPDIMSDAAYAIITQDSRSATGQFYIDETFLRSQGVADFEQYMVTPGATPFTDLYLEDND